MEEFEITVPVGLVNEIYRECLKSSTEGGQEEEEEGGLVIKKESLPAKAIIGGKTITLLKLAYVLTLTKLELKVDSRTDTAKLQVECSFKFSSVENENAKQLNCEADVDISLDPITGKIGVKPKYAMLKSEILVGNEESVIS